MKNIYSHGTGSISSLFNKLLQGHLELSAFIILIILFWSVNTLVMLLNLPSK